MSSFVMLKVNRLRIPPFDVESSVAGVSGNLWRERSSIWLAETIRSMPARKHRERSRQTLNHHGSRRLIAH